MIGICFLWIFVLLFFFSNAGFHVGVFLTAISRASVMKLLLFANIGNIVEKVSQAPEIWEVLLTRIQQGDDPGQMLSYGCCLLCMKMNEENELRYNTFGRTLC